MSTKLYDGYRLAPGLSAFAFARDLRATLDPLYEGMLNRAVVSDAVRRIDVAHLLGADRPEQAYSAACDRISAAFKDDRFLQFEAAFGQDPADGRIYAVIYPHGVEEYEQAWNAMPGVEAWPYWNNTDRPQDLTDEQWDERRDTWARVLPSFAVLQDTLVFQLLGEFPGCPGVSSTDTREPLEILAEAMPSPAERARAAARTLILDDLTAQGVTGWSALERLHEHWPARTEQVQPQLPALTIREVVAGPA